ncbi:hypothetical protein BVRB_8g192980 [Beta vulgaris subsp. vulgaris]|nr:hypothetical protein BVRB_8g192980 [Beta vulgaris subsp. vulgaris]
MKSKQRSIPRCTLSNLYQFKPAYPALVHNPNHHNHLIFLRASSKNIQHTSSDDNANKNSTER